MDFRRLFGRWDLLIIAFVLVMSAGAWILLAPDTEVEPTTLRVIRLLPGGGSEVVQEISLPAQEDKWLEGPAGGMALRVDGREATVHHAECPRQICVEMGYLRTAGDRSICVPNGLIVELISPEESPYDHILR